MHRPGNLETLWVGLLLSTIWVQPLPAYACSLAYMGIHQRRSYPPAGSVNVPTNARIVVAYTWINIRAPGLDLALRKSDGSAVATSVSTISSSILANFPPDSRRIRRRIIELQAVLEPNTVYEVVDRHPSVPCHARDTADCESVEATVFATFTTGEGPDMTPPHFEGLKTVSSRTTPVFCESSGCCGPYVFKNLTLWWDAASDDRAGDAVTYNIYRDGQLLLPVVSESTLTGLQTCSGSSLDWPSLPSGAYLVKAVDWSGNEDMNSSVQIVPDLCASMGRPADGGADGGQTLDSSATPDSSLASSATPDSSLDSSTTPDSSLDNSATPDSSLTLPDATAVVEADRSGEANDTSCSCRVGGTSSRPSWFAYGIFGVLLLGWRRRRPRLSAGLQGGRHEPRSGQRELRL